MRTGAPTPIQRLIGPPVSASDAPVVSVSVSLNLHFPLSAALANDAVVVHGVLSESRASESANFCQRSSTLPVVLLSL